MARPPRVAVVGHVEWVDVVAVDHLPRPGEIVHASGIRSRAGGGGAMAAFQLAALAGSCTFLCALGDDRTGDDALGDLEARGVTVRAVRRAGKGQRRAITLLDAAHERSIVVARERLVPWGSDDLGWDDAATWDAVYVTGGDAAAVRAARAAKVVVATPRARDALVEAGIVLDVVVGSASDGGERVDETLAALARTVVQTEGAAGGHWRPGGASDDLAEARLCDAAGAGRWSAAPLPGTPHDSYGCGDTFAAGLTYALGAGLPLPDACALGARCGAATLCLPAPDVASAATLLDGAPLRVA
ncbi:PfkB family carbohydrate kinase [Conexibacter sp. SYSU D00693]|uniref:PfkB family carbohydrate kinase n=1 Tax=Conexibacter sp. SYSU D00693 TaxID=2812560 RepID=UPI00196AB79A|nr:PfkB family carbohydrate kinase [Conexibacter sp. SYSU D00693]